MIREVQVFGVEVMETSYMCFSHLSFLIIHILRVCEKMKTLIHYQGLTKKKRKMGLWRVSWQFHRMQTALKPQACKKCNIATCFTLNL